jgi:hypothetical protein
VPRAQCLPGRHWVIYLRQSRNRKNSRGELSQVSIEVQEEQCRRVIAEMDPCPASIRVIVDQGRPGGRGRRRPGRDELVGLLTSSQVNAVMALRTDRIGRDIGESEELWNLCVEHDAFIAATDCRDLSQPIYRAVRFGVAHQENEDKSRYSTILVQRRRDKRLPPLKTGWALGLRWEGDRLAIDEREWPAVETMYYAFDGSGPFSAPHSLNAIARLLNANSRLYRRRGERAGQWDAAAVSRTLRCSWYVGHIPDGFNEDGTNRDYLTGQEFIDPEVWMRVQSRLNWEARTASSDERPLSGLLYCALCDGWSAMSLCYSKRTRKDGSVYKADRYRCTHHRHDPAFCVGTGIIARDVEQFLVAQLAAALGSDELADARLKRMQKGLSADQKRDLDRHKRALVELHEQERKLLKQAIRFSEGVIDDELRELHAQREHHTRERDRLLGLRQSSPAAVARLRAEVAESGPLTWERWEQLPNARRGEFLRLFFPDGMLVGPLPYKGARVPVQTRLRVRRAADVARTQQRHDKWLGLA